MKRAERKSRGRSAGGASTPGEDGPGGGRPVPLLYRLLLWLLPGGLRREYGGEMGQLFARRLAEAVRRERPLVWLRGLADVAAAGVGERWSAGRSRAPLDARAPSGGRARRLFDDLRLDARFAARALARTPGFTAAAVLTLGLGLGVLTGLFSVVDAVMLRPLPYAHAERLAVITSPALDLTTSAEWQGAQRVAEATATYAIAGGTAQTPNGAVALRVLPAGRGLLEMVGIRASAGRGFVDADHAPGAPPVALVTPTFARRWYGDEAPIGRAIEIDGRAYEIVGAIERDEFLRYRNLDVWIPHESVEFRGASLLARLPAGVTAAAAAAALTPLAERLATPEARRELAQSGRPAVRVTPARDAVLLGIDNLLWTLFGAGLVVLLLAAVNVGSLLVGRSVDRAGELSVRAALGAGRGRLLRQLVAEAALLAALAVVVALAVAAATPVLLALGPDVVPRSREIGLDLRAAAFAVGAAGAAVFLFGAPPGLAAARAAVAVRAGRGRTRSRRAGRAQAALAVVQVAAAVVLVVGSALMVRSWAAVRPDDPGFAVDGRTALSLVLPPDGYADDAAARAFGSRLAERLAALPGVDGAALATDLPLTGTSYILPVAAVDGIAQERAPNVHFRAVTANYFALMEMPIVAGRGLLPDDRAGAAPVAVVNERAAARLWPGESPLGRSISLEDRPDRPVSATVVGVVRDAWTVGPRPSPEVFVPFDQYPYARFNVVLASAGAVDHAAVREALAELDPRLPVRELAPLAERIDWSHSLARFQALLLGLLGAVALFLAAMGCFAVLSRLVAGRTRELGIRMALGAHAADVVALVLKRAGALALLGIAAGAALALASTRLLAAHLHGVTPTDPLSFAASAAVLGAVVLIAALRPALRAARTDPAGTLRRD